jgi:hypothetical protein
MIDMYRLGGAAERLIADGAAISLRGWHRLELL